MPIPKVLGVIPSRFASTRLPGKPLADIAGEPMVVRVLKRAQQAQWINEVVVATDDARILHAVRESNGTALMTSESCASGTDRVAEIAGQMDADIVVNIQGDEPFIDPASIDTAVQLLIEDENAAMGTLACPIHRMEDLFSPDTVKVVIDDNSRALYFSRSAIPFCRDARKQGDWLAHGVFHQHIGLYVYRSEFLKTYTQWPQSPLEKLEKLEQLRALENGVNIHVGIVDEVPLSVDTQEDLEKARAMAGISK